MAIQSDCSKAVEPLSMQSEHEFRPDVQAMRAIAMAGVVLYHIWPAAVPGGFVGVDVFFVISGFLITQHLVREIERSGSIQLGAFWARRARRLLPAGFLVLLVSLLLVIWVMPTAVAKFNVQQIAASGGYLENWYLIHKTVDYLARENSPAIVQHYWSLSVEEQFYAVWPFLLLSGVTLARGCRRSVRSKLNVVLWGVALLSLASCVVVTGTKPWMAFFGTHNRAWEFAVGGLVAVTAWRGASVVRGLLGWLGFSTVILSMFVIDSTSRFPGLIAVIPVSGAAMILLADAGRGVSAANRILRLKVLQFLGEHSYAIYLWHWPIVVVAPWVLHRSPGISEGLSILVLLPILAMVTKRFVEDPVRRGAFWSSGLWPSYAFAATGTVALGVAAFGYQSWVAAGTRVSALAANHAIASGDECYGAGAMVVGRGCHRPFARPANLDLAWPVIDTGPDGSCQVSATSAEPIWCVYGEKAAPTAVIAVVGNSHALRLVPALEEYGKPLKWQIILAAKTDCLGLLTTAPRGSSSQASCLAWTTAVQARLIATPKLKAVVFGSHAGAENYLLGEQHTAQSISEAEVLIRALWKDLGERNIHVIVTEDVPGMRPDSDPECLARSTAKYDPCWRSRAELVKPNALSSLAQRSPTLARYVELSPYICDKERCHAIIGGVVVYSDSHHITGTFSRSLAGFVGPQIEAAIAGSVELKSLRAGADGRG